MTLNRRRSDAHECVNAIPADAFAMIIGAMKGGTSSFYNYLIQHPQICGAVVKEPEFFSKHQRHKHRCDNYFDLWNFDPKQHRVTLEASTGYTKFPLEPSVPKDIFEYGLRPKMIYCVRNPFERIISHYEYAKFFPEWGPQDVLTEQSICFSNYFLQLERFREYFPKADILIVDFDEVARSPQSAANRAFAWLGLPHATIDSSVVYNKTGVTNPSGERLGTSTAMKRYTLTESESNRVLHLLKKDIGAFGKEYDFDVSKWGF